MLNRSTASTSIKERDGLASVPTYLLRDLPARLTFNDDRRSGPKDSFGAGVLSVVWFCVLCDLCGESIYFTNGKYRSLITSIVHR